MFQHVEDLQDSSIQKPSVIPIYERSSNTLNANKEFSGSCLQSPPSEHVEIDRDFSQIRAKLCDEELWNKFNSVGTEMVLTKTGRRIFPAFRVRFKGLARHKYYKVMMGITRVDDNRYKFQNGAWIACGKGEMPYEQDPYPHPMSAVTGAHLMNAVVSFHKVKLTNSEGKTQTGTFLLHSMHRYQLCVYISSCQEEKEISSFNFPVTTFITVTAYQNALLSQLKIANNPFARGFRPDGARGKSKRHYTYLSDFNDSHFSATTNRGLYDETTRINATNERVEIFPTVNYQAWSRRYSQINHLLPTPLGDAAYECSPTMYHGDVTMCGVKKPNRLLPTHGYCQETCPVRRDSEVRAVDLNRLEYSISNASHNEAAGDISLSQDPVLNNPSTIGEVRDRKTQLSSNLQNSCINLDTQGSHVRLSTPVIFDAAKYSSATTPTNFLSSYEVSRLLSELQTHP